MPFPPPPPPGARAGHRCRSAPLFGERQATPPDTSQSQTPMPVLRRLSKKGPPREPSPSQTETGHFETPPDARHLGDRPSAASAQPPLLDGPLVLTWDQISALASRPILVDRQIPKPCRGLFEQAMDHCLRHMPPLSDPMPGIGDHLYILRNFFCLGAATRTQPTTKRSRPVPGTVRQLSVENGTLCGRQQPWTPPRLPSEG